MDGTLISIGRAMNTLCALLVFVALGVGGGAIAAASDFSPLVGVLLGALIGAILAGSMFGLVAAVFSIQQNAERTAKLLRAIQEDLEEARGENRAAAQALAHPPHPAKFLPG